MKLKVIQDSIIFISDVTFDQFKEAKRFCSDSLTLKVKEEGSKEAVPVCTMAYADEGSVSQNGIVFDSTTEAGNLCKTLIATEGNCIHLKNDEKVKILSEEFAGLILKMNDLEVQVLAALKDNAAKIKLATESIEAIEL